MKNENPRRGNGTGLAFCRSGDRAGSNSNIGGENLPPLEFEAGEALS